MFKLVIQDDEGKTTVVPLIRDEITIGRKEGNTIRLTERNVSRRHARIVRNNGAVAIEDLGSYNGVRVNGTRIAQRTSLSVSDRVQIGDYLIELKAEGIEQVSDDGKTQPIERMDSGYLEGMATAPTIPPQAVPAAPTQPMPAPVVALADTDPQARAIAAPGVAVAPMGQAAGHARLVVLSSNFAGQEWSLERSQMIVGRTEDNDVVINHRSISRNHAKISREPDTGRYTISDLQSSNGVRVNGEEYGKVELRRGDIIDLGHVRLRFIEPGEDFVFGRDAQIADVPTGGRGRGLMVAAAVLLLGVGATAVFLLTRKNETTKPPGVVEGSGSDDVGTGSDVAVMTPDAPTQAALPVEGKGDIPKILPRCRDLQAKEEWFELNKCADEILAIDAQSPDGGGLKEQAQREQKNKLLWGDLQDAATKKNNAQDVIDRYKKIGQDSIYYERATKLHDQVKKVFIDEQVAWARSRAKAHECKDIDVRAGQVGRIWEEAGTALRSIECKDSGGGGGGGGSRPQCRNDQECNGADVCQRGKCVAAAGGGGGGGGGTPCDANALLEEAKTAFGSNQWSKVLTKAEAANSCQSSRFARMLALRAACRLQNRSKASRYWKEFENDTQAKQACVGVMP